MIQKTNSSPPIVYEVEEDRPDGTKYAYTFDDSLVIKSRQAALNYFLRTTFEDDGILAKLYVRHLRSAEKVEIANTYTIMEPFECLRSLEKERGFFAKESVACHLLIFDKNYTGDVRIFWPRNKLYFNWKTKSNYIICSHMYWAFLGRKKEHLLPY